MNQNTHLDHLATKQKTANGAECTNTTWGEGGRGRERAATKNTLKGKERHQQTITTTNQTTRKHVILCPLTRPVAILTGNLWPSSVPLRTLLLSTSDNYSSRFPRNSFFGPFTVLQIKVEYNMKQTRTNIFFYYKMFFGGNDIILVSAGSL